MGTTKRILCAILALLMMLSLVACGQETSAPTETVIQPPTQPPTEAPTEPAPAHAQGCGKYLLSSNYPMEFGAAQYSTEEIRAMKDYSAEELQAAISTLADMIQYVIENDYGDNSKFVGDIKFRSGGYEWSVNKSPRGALLSQSDSCGAISNLARYILEDDYDEEGYIGWSAAEGGHVFNYFMRNGIVLPFDFTTIMHDHVVLQEFVTLDCIESIAEYVLLTTFDIGLHAIRVERDVHRDHAPCASVSMEPGKPYKLVTFLDYSARDEIELLYFNKEWMKGEGLQSFEYHPYFENIGVSNDIVPKELIDSADMNYYPEEVVPSPLPDEEIPDDPLMTGDCNINAIITANQFFYDSDSDGNEEKYVFGVAVVGLSNTSPLGIDTNFVTLGKGSFISRTVYPCVWRVVEDGTYTVVNEFASILTDVSLKFNCISVHGKEPTAKAISNAWQGCTEVTFGPFIMDGGAWQYEFTAKLGDQTLTATAVTQIQPG